MIVITGATGQLGQGVVDRLLERVPAEQIGVSVRDPERARAHQDRGVRVRRGDFQDAKSLEHAFEGAARVLIVSSNSSGEEAISHHQTAIDAAKAAGVERIVYTSHMGSNLASAFGPMPDHAATEQALEASGVPFTSLRNGFYAASGIMLMGAARETGELLAPEDGPVSWTAHADLAEAAVMALTTDTLDGLTAPLTGAEALDLEDLAARASELTGRPIERVVVSDEDFKAGLVAKGVPTPQADFILGLYIASRNHEFAKIDPTLERLLGRAPITMREVLAA